jgi:hypothetical protein
VPVAPDSREDDATMRRLVALATFAVVLGGAPTPAPAAPDLRADPGQSLPGALVWGNGVFSSGAGLTRWLAAHHETYASWARLHPSGRTILATAASLPVRFRPSQQAPTTSPPPVLPPLAAGGGSGGSGPFFAVLLVLAALLLAAGLVPTRRLGHRFPFAAEVARRRLTCGVVGLAIAVGIAAAKLAG